MQLKKLLIDNLTISFALSRVTMIMQVQYNSRQLKRKGGVSYFLPDRGDHANSRIAFSMHKVEREVPGLNMHPPSRHKD